MEEMYNDEVLLEIRPKFKFLYEIFMPTGRKIKNSMITVIVLCIFNLLIFTLGNNVSGLDTSVLGNFKLVDVAKSLFLIGLICFILKFIFDIVVQKMQYQHISYRFYSKHMVYEDDFLNKHRKNIDYNNVKEIEIRRTVWDRIMKCGVIIIYTNAENKKSNGLVVFGLQDPEKVYDIISNIIKEGKDNND